MIKTYASLFTGIGGFDLPAYERGWQIVFQVERDEFCNRVLEKNFPGVPRFRSVESFEALPYRGQIDLLTSGFPCQPFSPLGKQQGTADDRYVWEHNKRILSEVRPRIFVAENVRRIISSEAFEHVLLDLEALNYKIFPFCFPTGIADGWDMRYRTIFFAYPAQYRISEGKIQAGLANQTPLQPKGQGQHFSIGVYGGNNVVVSGLSESHLIRDPYGFPSWMDRIKTCGNAVHVGFIRRLYNAIELIESCMELIPDSKHTATDPVQHKTTAIEETVTHATTSPHNLVSTTADPLTLNDIPKQKEATGTTVSKSATQPGIKSIYYPGNKHSAGIPQRIINQITPHDVFVSGCLGTCAILAYKRPAISNFGIDVNLDALQEYWTARTDVKLVRADFLTWIAQFNFSKSTQQRWFIYLDPPYLLSTRRSGKIIYDHELSDEDHSKLIAWARLTTDTSNVHIAISHYPCAEYDELLKHGWRKIEYPVATHQGTVTEALYMNYPEPEELHEYTYLGTDRTKRQNQKRMTNNIVNKLKKLPPLRRNAILAEVTQLLQQSSATPR